MSKWIFFAFIVFVIIYVYIIMEPTNSSCNYRPKTRVVEKYYSPKIKQNYDDFELDEIDEIIRY